MPVYEYKCLRCKEIHEKVQRFTDEPLTICPDCGGRLKKIISNTSFILKGTGWYKTDYASGATKNAVKAEKKEDKNTETKAESKTDTKTDTKTKTETAAKA